MPSKTVEEQRAAGWVEHDGKECPVPRYSRPGVMIRGFDRPHLCQMPGGSDEALAFEWTWNSRTPAADIIAYRMEAPDA